MKIFVGQLCRPWKALTNCQKKIIYSIATEIVVSEWKIYFAT